MQTRFLLAAVACALFGTCAYAQTPLLVDPTKAPVRLAGWGWQSATRADRSGEVNLYIDKINPDGTLAGRLDFLGGRNCKALKEPIKDGRMTVLMVEGG